MHILIIDDDYDFCNILKNLLEKRDYTVSVAHSLREGLSLLDEHLPDIIFMDNYLPDGEGWEQAKLIGKRFPSIHINLMSAEDKSFMRMEEFDHSIWEKPITREQIENYFRFLKA